MQKDTVRIRMDTVEIGSKRGASNTRASSEQRVHAIARNRRHDKPRGCRITQPRSATDAFDGTLTTYSSWIFIIT